MFLKDVESVFRLVAIWNSVAPQVICIFEVFFERIWRPLIQYIDQNFVKIFKKSKMLRNVPLKSSRISKGAPQKSPQNCILFPGHWEPQLWSTFLENVVTDFWLWVVLGWFWGGCSLEISSLEQENITNRCTWGEARGIIEKSDDIVSSQDYILFSGHWVPQPLLISSSKLVQRAPAGDPEP